MAYDKVVDSVRLESDLVDIADAISKKTVPPYNGKALKFPRDFIEAVNSIPTGKPVATEQKQVTITQNGQTVVEPSGNNLLTKVTVNVNVPTGGGASDIEIVDFVPPALPTFKHQSGGFEIWGWGIKDEAQAWMSSYYTFHGKQYAGAIDDTDHEMTLTIVNGKAQGIPEMTRGKCIAIVR